MLTYTIATLFAKHSPANHATDAPALECQVVLKSGYQMQGILSHTGERMNPELSFVHEAVLETGVLRMAVPALQPDPQYPRNEALAKKIVAEHYFDYDDVECVILIHQVAPDDKKIVLSGS